MNRLSTKLMTAALASASLLFLGGATLSAHQAGNAAATATSAATKAVKAKAPATPPPSAADIADAKSKGLVWVNLHTGKYHKSDAATYGTTKSGKFMSEADAQAAGYKAAQEPTAKAKKVASAAAAAAKQ